MSRNLRIIDLSKYQTVTDMTAIRKSGIIGVIHKATQGASYADSKFAARKRDFAGAGFGWASYHFLTPGRIAEQMAHYIAVAQPQAGERVVIDYEQDGCTLDDLRTAVAWLRSYAPKNPICIYGGSLLESQIGASNYGWLIGTSLWTAEYTTRDQPRWARNQWARWDLWQYSDGHLGGTPNQVPGVSQCDCSEFNGTDDECRAWFDGSLPQVKPVASVSPSPVVSKPLIKIGDHGLAVAEWQRKLGLQADGVFGPDTLKATKQFQAAHGLVVDGIVGAKTWGAANG